MNHSSRDAGIPVLTEVISETGIEHAPAAAPASPAPVVHESAPTLEKQAAFDWDDAKWDRLEREIRERILGQVLEQVDTLLEQRVRDSLADVLQTAVEGLADQLRGGLQHTLKDVVTRIVSQEITRLQTTKE